jgi:hypothetical protein
MISAFIVAAAIAALAPAPATKPAAPATAAFVTADAPQITAQTEITVTLPIGVLEAAKLALHKAYTGAEADPVIDAISKQEQDAVAKLQAAAKADRKP